MPRTLTLELDGVQVKGYLKKFTRDMVYGKNRVERRSKDGEIYKTAQLTGDGVHIIPAGGLGGVNLAPDGKIVEKVITVDEKEQPLYTIPSMYAHPVVLEHTIPILDYFHYAIELTYVFIGENAELILKDSQTLLEQGRLRVFSYAYYDTTSIRDAILLPKDKNLFVMVGEYRAPEFLKSSDIMYYDELLDEALQEDLLFEVW